MPVILLVVFGCLLLWIGVWCVRQRKATRGRDRDGGGSSLLGGTSPRQILLVVNGWPNVLAGVGALAFALVIVADELSDSETWSPSVQVACAGHEVSVRNDELRPISVRVDRVRMRLRIDDEDAEATYVGPPFEAVAGGGEFTFRYGLPAEGPCAEERVCSLVLVDLNLAAGRNERANEVYMCQN